MPVTNTYDGNPYTTDAQGLIDTVRFLIGDTAAPWQLADGEITGLLTNNVNDPYQAAMEACVSLAAKYARDVDKSVGPASISASNRSKAYMALRGTIQQQSIRHSAPTIYMGGQSKQEAENDRMDDDLIQPSFTVGMTDNPELGGDGTQGNGMFTQVEPE